MANSLVIEDLHAGYGAVRVLSGVSLRCGEGETVALLGTNGNGKSTLIKCVTGQLKPSRGRVSAQIDGQTHDLVGMPAQKVVDLGISLVAEGRRLFPRLTVEESLLLGALRRAARPHRGLAGRLVSGDSGPDSDAGADVPARERGIRDT